MTGNVLKRLREAYGLKQTDVASAGNYRDADAIYMTERRQSWVTGCNQGGANVRRQRGWLRYLNVLRELTGRQRAVCGDKSLPMVHLPPGTTHTAHGEPLKAVEKNGRQLIFRHDGHDWVRSARNNLVGAQKV